ncbi:transmembrane 7 superfamily member 3 [Harpegnathos saltator]|uniref:transmembrane 7 superfamily member 3 n=1 Tax=Harpegnathos saltator TaxID=610380 RepID=UPI0005901086|nr:transmembrane 7 superfamily member 3 [Harpegnathos saltator]
MRRGAVTLLLALPLLVGIATTVALENATIKLDNGTITASLLNYQENDSFKKRLNLPPYSGVTITVTDIPPDVSFVVLQIHTYQYNATLAYDKKLLDKVSRGSLFGSNIGLYLKTRNVIGPVQVFLTHDNVHDLDALLVIVPYGRTAPIPGGCNMEFEIEIAPYQKLHMENEMIIVDTQPAMAIAASGSPIPCEKNPVRHSMYRLHLPKQDFTPETYFNAIASMLTVRDIVRNGTEIPPISTISSMRRIYSMYAGTGFVYAVVATYRNYSSAYVPTFSYGCSYLLYPKSCQVLNETFPMVVCAIVLFLGVLSVIIGHRPIYACVDHSLPNLAMGGFIGYTIAVAAGDPGTATNVLIGLTSAIIAACLSLCQRISRGILSKLLFLLPPNLPLAFLCGCIAYLYAPAYMFCIVEHEWSFWLLFASLVLTVASLLLITCQLGEIITRAVFGSYFVVVALDYYVGGNLKYIIINMIRRITVPGFHSAFVYPPVQTADLALIGLWIVLIMIRLIKMTLAQMSEPSISGERQALLASCERNDRIKYAYINYRT